MVSHAARSAERAQAQTIPLASPSGSRMPAVNAWPASGRSVFRMTRPRLVHVDHVDGDGGGDGSVPAVADGDGPQVGIGLLVVQRGLDGKLPGVLVDGEGAGAGEGIG